uniref:N-acyl homoserine lactonase (AHL-lactonase) (Acyl-homoserine lactonase) (EC) n=1 Tax=Ganoderma boninense TaxID=34458 RepID=A0A5K1K6S7_9APHY|nr:N-acyl homoserine lactonase (AHL-lactonase) (Acyl-homoserine lactonase) (EC [Ganoderma boninense]
MSLPPPVANQAFCDVSALEAGHIKIPLAWVLDDVSDSEFISAPTLSFLVRHRTRNDGTLVFDLGLRKDRETLPPAIIKQAAAGKSTASVPLDVVDSLAKGGTMPSDVEHQFFVGEGSRALVADRYPTNPDSVIPADVVPEDRTTYLDPQGWRPLGPFLHALDFHGDGSVYAVNAGHGHMPGHLNLLVRTSGDGGWIYLAGDSAHHWDLLNGGGGIGRHPLFGCAHEDPDAAEAHIE